MNRLKKIFAPHESDFVLSRHAVFSPRETAGPLPLQHCKLLADPHQNPALLNKSLIHANQPFKRKKCQSQAKTNRWKSTIHPKNAPLQHIAHRTDRQKNRKPSSMQLTSAYVPPIHGTRNHTRHEIHARTPRPCPGKEVGRPMNESPRPPFFPS